MSDPVLCYVEGEWAYFTTQPLSDQWGDDWNDAPYEHNAGLPYGPGPSDVKAGKHWDIVVIAFNADLETPSNNVLNSSYSVQDINAGQVAWLRSPSYVREPVAIFAGTQLSEFKQMIRRIGGRVYVEDTSTNSD